MIMHADNDIYASGPATEFVELGAESLVLHPRRNGGDSNELTPVGIELGPAQGSLPVAILAAPAGCG